MASFNKLIKLAFLPCCIFLTSFIMFHTADFPVRFTDLVGPCTGSRILAGGGGGHDILCEDGRVFETLDSGITWIEKKIKDNWVAKDIRFKKTNDNSIYGIAIGGNGQAYYSTGGSDNWISSSTGTSENLNNAFFTPEGFIKNLFVIGDNSTVLFSSDGGKTWVKQSTSSQSNHFKSVFFVDVSNGWITGTMGTLHKTTNGGINWSLNQANQSTVDLNDVFFKDPNNGFVVGNQGTIIKTENGGQSWQSIPSGTTENLNDVEFYGNNNGLIVGDKGTSLFTTNGGSSWSSFDIGSTGNLKCIYVDNNGFFWVASSDGMIYSNDPAMFKPSAPEELEITSPPNSDAVGLKWKDKSDNENGFYMERKKESNQWERIAVLDKNTTTYTDRNVERGKSYEYRVCSHNSRGNSKYSNVVSILITDVKKSELIPSEFSLSQNFPNPFNPETNISFAIPTREFVQIKIYGLRGNEIATLINEEKAPGSYTIKFNGSSLASGIYYCKMTAGAFNKTIKIVFLK